MKNGGIARWLTPAVHILLLMDNRLFPTTSVVATGVEAAAADAVDVNDSQFVENDDGDYDSHDDAAAAAAEEVDDGIWDYLDPRVAYDEDTMQHIKSGLSDGMLVKLKYPFQLDFAERVSRLVRSSDRQWELIEHYNANGTNHRYHVLTAEDDAATFGFLHDMFAHPETRALMSALSGYDCQGEVASTIKWYQPDDYTNPFNNPDDSVTMIWDLTTRWGNRFGGYFIWSDAWVRYGIIASRFNSVSMFSANSPSLHSISPVQSRSNGHKRFLVSITYASLEQNPHRSTPTVLQSVEERFETERNPPAKLPRREVHTIQLDPTSSELDQEDECANADLLHDGADGTATTATTANTTNNSTSTDFQVKQNASVLDYLNPQLFEYMKESGKEKIQQVLASDGLVIIRNAFQKDFADFVWSTMNNKTCQWDAAQVQNPTGFRSDKSWDPDCGPNAHSFNQSKSIFQHPDTKKFVGELVQRNTDGEAIARGSKFKINDYTGPHNDSLDYRVLTFLWYLCKDWNPEWGGALVYGSALPEKAYVHASYNTMALFSVGLYSSHLVTTISPHSAGNQRMAIGGWYTSSIESITAKTIDDPLEDLYATRVQRRNITAFGAEYLKSLPIGAIKNKDRRQKIFDIVQLVQAENERPKGDPTMITL